MTSAVTRPTPALVRPTARAAVEALQRMGYTRAESMAGGWRAWTEAGKEIDPRP